MVAWCEETPAALGSGEPVATKLRRIAEKNYVNDRVRSRVRK